MKQTKSVSITFTKCATWKSRIKRSSTTLRLRTLQTRSVKNSACKAFVRTVLVHACCVKDHYKDLQAWRGLIQTANISEKRVSSTALLLQYTDQHLICLTAKDNREELIKFIAELLTYWPFGKDTIRSTPHPTDEGQAILHKDLDVLSRWEQR